MREAQFLPSRTKHYGRRKQKVVFLLAVFCLILGIYGVNRQPADQKFTCLATEASTKPHWLF